MTSWSCLSKTKVVMLEENIVGNEIHIQPKVPILVNWNITVLSNKLLYLNFEFDKFLISVWSHLDSLVA